MVCQTIFKGLGKVAVNLNYDDSRPSPALVCPCGRGDAHVATGNTKLGYWTCTQNATWCGKLTPLQLLWLEKITTHPYEAATDPSEAGTDPVIGRSKAATDPSEAATDRSEAAIGPSKAATVQHPLLDDGSNASAKKSTFGALSESDHLSKLLHQCQLNDHASKWREIGTHLGFRQGELDNIQGKPSLFTEGPKAWLREMLREWLEWAPGDSRGSSSSASIECLKCALDKSGLAQTALEVESCLKN
jgi:hypothetical protein